MCIRDSLHNALNGRSRRGAYLVHQLHGVGSLVAHKCDAPLHRLYGKVQSRGLGKAALYARCGEGVDIHKRKRNGRTAYGRENRKLTLRQEIHLSHRLKELYGDIPVFLRRIFSGAYGDGGGKRPGVNVGHYPDNSRPLRHALLIPAESFAGGDCYKELLPVNFRKNLF